ncbi:RHE_PE00001 family protein [Xaviernesmea oryzae]|uniref:HTH DNA binding domain-containing protein n=1 Tax=Xaviernesmea oryzae TaxID=464029 RepID=A0A1X7FXD6_9HYPH|nr:RHE_PE00001 family protein [Xaviernesmea oryzae]SMF60394.1 HTH DNA binding domain-containing protein [Xaviernesmea oryzae]
MGYDLAKLPLQALITPLSAATAALTRLDERLSRSPVGKGWIERAHFADAAASLWIDGELIHIEDLVLYDAGMGIRAPTHELTIAYDVLRTRRRIVTHPRTWALTAEGLRSLCGGGKSGGSPARAVGVQPTIATAETQDQNELRSFREEEDFFDPFARELAQMDAVLARSEAVLSGTFKPSPSAPIPRERSPLVYEPDWDESERLAEWQAVLSETEGLPPLLRTVLLLDAWNQLQVLQHAPWLGRLLAAATLRGADVTVAHLAAFNLGLKAVSRERRASRDRDTRLIAFLDALAAAAEAGLKEHDRLLLAKQQMQRRLTGKRQSSRLPHLIELVMEKPIVSAGMIAEVLGVTPQGALKIIGALNLRELTGRGRFRAWGIV